MSATEGLHPIETASIGELRALQLDRMRHTLEHAYQSSTFYRAQFDTHGIHPGDLKSLSDITSFPFTTKQDLRDHYPFGMFAVPMEQVVRVHASSGTTGQATVVGYTAHDIAQWTEVVARSIYAAGGRRGDQSACRVRVWSVYRRTGGTLWGGEAWLHRHSRLGWANRPPSAAHSGF